MSIHDDTLQGLQDMLAYVKGDNSKGRSRVIEVKNLSVKPLKKYSKEEIKRIRLGHNLTLKTFADCFGVSQKTVESWERGDNTPSGASIRLFQLMEINSNVLEEYEILSKT